MSIATELEKSRNYLSDAYSKCSEKGATIPSQKNLMNLASCIDSISVGSGGGNNNYNVFDQEWQPNTKNGVWIKRHQNIQGYPNVYFGAYFGGKGDFINSGAFDYLKSTSGIIGQVIVGDYLYCFGTSASTSYKYDLRNKKYLGTINVPSVGAQTGHGLTIGAVYYPADDCIYVFYRGAYNSGNYYPYYYVYYPSKNTFDSAKAFGGVTGAGITTVPLLYDDKIYWFSGHTNSNSSYIFILDLETKTLSTTQKNWRINTTYYYTSYSRGRYIYYIYENNLYEVDCKEESYKNLGSVGGSETYGYPYSMYVTGSKAFVFFSKGEKYTVFDIGLKTITECTPNTKYSVVSTLDQNVVFDPIEGILYFRTASTNVQAFQMENSPSAEGLLSNTAVIIQDLGYKNPIILQDSTNLQIGVSDVYVVDKGGLNGDLVVYIGDGEEWRLLKGRLRVTFNNGEETSYTSVTYGNTVEEPEMPSKDGYEFVCWTLNGSEYDFSTPVTENITLEAAWIENSPTFVDYIETTGTQYIDTGYYVNKNSEFILEGYLVSSGVLFGSGTDGQFVSACIMNHTNVYRARWRGNATSNVDMASTISCNTTRHSFKVNRTSFYIDDVLIGNLNSTYDFTETRTTYIFGWNTGVGTSKLIPTNARIYSFKIYDNGTLVRDFKPCHDTHGVYCLYDKVSATYFYNKGTGSFIAG